MRTHLFDPVTERHNQDGADFALKIRYALAPLFAEGAAEGLSRRDMGHLALYEVFDAELDVILGEP